MGVKSDRKKKHENETKKESGIVLDKSTTSNRKSLRKNNGRDIIRDTRFSSVHSDPRFQKLPKQQSQVTIDSRFSSVFTDNKFHSSSSRIDKRGKTKNNSFQNPLRHYYHMEDDKKPKQNEGDNNSSDDDSGLLDSESGSESEELKLNDKLASEADTDSTTSDTDDDDDDEGSSSEEEPAELEQEKTIPEIEQETHRLAVVNMDWGEVRAVDLYVLLRSFLPKGGQILSVSVYPSEFGLKCMEEEAVQGPVGLFDSDIEDDGEDNELDDVKLRAYEKSRLRYFYAVVECDSIATADYLYRTCDGTEFERTSNVLDLRFIPDSMEFKHPPRDVASEAPTNYEGVNFHTRALQHSTLKITWDEDEPQRAKKLNRKFTADQLAEWELKEFIASSEDDEEDEVVDGQFEKKTGKSEKYRALLTAGDDSDGNDDNDKDMEVTFNTGLEDLSKRILEKKRDKGSETVWDAYLRKRSEKKKARKNKSKDSSEDMSNDDEEQYIKNDDEISDNGDFFIKETSGMSKSRRKGKQETKKEQQASTAELELLVADDQWGDPSLKGYNLKPKKAKGKKGKVVAAENKIPDIDYEDPRFSALFKSPQFALDPTDPQYKRSAAYARQVAKKQQSGAVEEVPDATHLNSDKDIQPDSLSSEFSAVVRSVKRKSQQILAPSSSSRASIENGTSTTRKEKRGLSSFVEPAKKTRKHNQV
ncbi:hypothetical protein GIB67_038940 [Kingdonia uniflora]|uniref:NUC153 domain-containing protein n=1 Tax=Kingdonia uniflora TaxID=39325 RepID=A0A7J7KZV8_9MAGN|nr:hypothetical protein GIB67_038940 [Kingdonia uniflora]